MKKIYEIPKLKIIKAVLSWMVVLLECGQYEMPSSSFGLFNFVRNPKGTKNFLVKIMAVSVFDTHVRRPEC